MEFDYTNLKKKINEECGLEELNKSIIWDGGDLYKRLEGKLYFSIDEMNKVMELLDINHSEVAEYFFTHRTFEISKIDAELGQMYDDVEKLKIIANQIHDDYFLSYDPEDEEDINKIAADFLRNRALIHIVVDNIFDMKKSIDKIADTLDLNLR
jgi:CRISPR/Cas system-associated exonuclease Cas4 (RecB family)